MIQQKIRESSTLALLERVREMKKKGADVVSFAAGEPDFPTPSFVVSKARDLLKSGQIKYVSTPGVPALRKAVAEDYKKRLKVKWAKPENVIVTAGAKQGIYLIFNALLNPGDEVICPAPYWVSYPSLIEVCGGVTKRMPTRAEEGFFPTVPELELYYTAKTKALIFSSPSNPTGAMISEKRLKEIVDWCRQNKVYLIFDELYERLILDSKAKHFCPLKFGSEDDSEYIISVNALSKSLSMTGWRLGYVVTHSKSIKSLSPLQGQILTSLPGFMQEAAAYGIPKAEDFLKGLKKKYAQRLDIMLKALDSFRDIQIIKPRGAFYLFINVSSVIKKRNLRDDLEFCEKLLDEKRVACVPGTSFGSPGWIRLSFATSDREVKEGMKRLCSYF